MVKQKSKPQSKKSEPKLSDSELSLIGQNGLLRQIVDQQARVIRALRADFDLERALLNSGISDLKTDLLEARHDKAAAEIRANSLNAQNDYQTETIRNMARQIDPLNDRIDALVEDVKWYQAGFSSPLLADLCSASRWTRLKTAWSTVEIAQRGQTPPSIAFKGLKPWKPRNNYAFPHNTPTPGVKPLITTNAREDAVFELTQHSFGPSCGHDKSKLELRFYERPGGAPGNAYVCTVCHPSVFEPLGTFDAPHSVVHSQPVQTCESLQARGYRNVEFNVSSGEYKPDANKS
jgi:hypothetical protein